MKITPKITISKRTFNYLQGLRKDLLREGYPGNQVVIHRIIKKKEKRFVFDVKRNKFKDWSTRINCVSTIRLFEFDKDYIAELKRSARLRRKRRSGLC